MNAIVYNGSGFAPFAKDQCAAPPPSCTPDENDSTTPHNMQPLDEQVLHPGCFRLEAGSAEKAPTRVTPSAVHMTLRIDVHGASLLFCVEGVNRHSSTAAACLSLARVPESPVIQSWQTCNGVEMRPKIETNDAADRLMNEARESASHNASMASSDDDCHFFEISKIRAGASYAFYVVVRLRSFSWMTEVVSNGMPRRSFCDVGFTLPSFLLGEFVNTTVTVELGEGVTVALPSSAVAEGEVCFRKVPSVVWLSPAAFSDRRTSFPLDSLYFTPLFKVRIVRNEDLSAAFAMLELTPHAAVSVCNTLPSGATLYKDEPVRVVASTYRVNIVPDQKPLPTARKNVWMHFLVDESASMEYSSTRGFDENNERLAKRHMTDILRSLQKKQIPSLQLREFVHAEQNILFSIVCFHSSARVVFEGNLRLERDVEAACTALLRPAKTEGTSFCAAMDAVLNIAERREAKQEIHLVHMLTDGGCYDLSEFLRKQKQLARHSQRSETTVTGFGAWVSAGAARAATTMGTPLLLEEAGRAVVTEALKIVPRMLLRVLFEVVVEVRCESPQHLEVLSVRCVDGVVPPLTLPSELGGFCAVASLGDEFEVLLRYPETMPIEVLIAGKKVNATKFTEEDFEMMANLMEDGFEMLGVHTPKMISVDAAMQHLRLVDPLFLTAANETKLLKEFSAAREAHIVHLGKKAELLTSFTKAVAVVLDDARPPPPEAVPEKRPLLDNFVRMFPSDGICYRSLAAEVFEVQRTKAAPTMQQWLDAANTMCASEQRMSWKENVSGLLEKTFTKASPPKKFKVDVLASLDVEPPVVHEMITKDLMRAYIAAFPLLFPYHPVAAESSPVLCLTQMLSRIS